MSTPEITLARVHDVLDDEGAGPGELRVLVDRLWPRGVSKSRLAHDRWEKDIAPSTALRQAFHRGELGFDEFAARYREELARGGAVQALLERAAAAGAQRVVLLHAAKDTEHTHARVLREVLEQARG